MKRKSQVLSAAIAASLLALAAPAALAVTTDWGVHGALEYAAEYHTPGSFLDTFTFTLPVDDDLGSVTVANDLTLGGSQTKITGGYVNLFEGTFGDATPDTLKLSYTFDGTTGSITHHVGGLFAGPFYYQIGGDATGSSGGLYTLTSHFTPQSPVPEPETYGMLIAGLGLMGFIARRRAGKS